jgi:hypothetical protein
VIIPYACAVFVEVMSRCMVEFVLDTVRLIA